jgi:hypothetical protein
MRPFLDVPGASQPGKPAKEGNADVSAPVPGELEKKPLNYPDGHEGHHDEIHGENKEIFQMFIHIS